MDLVSLIGSTFFAPPHSFPFNQYAGRNYGGFLIIDGDREERTFDDVAGLLSEKASRSESVNEFKLKSQ